METVRGPTILLPPHPISFLLHPPHLPLLFESLMHLQPVWKHFVFFNRGDFFLLPPWDLSCLLSAVHPPAPHLLLLTRQVSPFLSRFLVSSFNISLVFTFVTPQSVSVPPSVPVFWRSCQGWWHFFPDELDSSIRYSQVASTSALWLGVLCFSFFFFLVAFISL